MIDFLSISITNGILIILLIVVLILFCLYIYTENKKLKEQIEELRKENKSLLEKKIMKQENVDSISIKNISTEKVNTNHNEKINNNELDALKKENIIKTKDKDNDISLADKVNNYSYYNLNNINDNHTITKDFNLNELVNKNNSLNFSKPEVMKEYDYLQEISNRLNEELKPQTIELTDYEKKQEEQAVISYKELLKHKDNNYILDEKQDTVKFIEELKNLRNSLK